MNLKYIINRYRYALIGSVLCIIIYIFNKELGIQTYHNFKSSVVQMLSMLPPIMIILGLLDEWVKRETFMKYMGKDSGVIGVLLSFMIAFFSAGPMYAAFPFVDVLNKKGVKFSNIMIFLNAWCIAKFSTLLLEFGAMGYEFTILRLLINIPGVIIMAYLIDYFVNKSNIIRNHQK